MSKTSVLVLDDEKEIRDMLSRHYRLKGYDVTTAADVDAAEKELSRQRFDVAICDIMMPGEKIGTDLLSTIRYEYPMTHAIMITGYVSLDNALTCMRRGADTCIFKPLDDLSELDQAVDRALEDIDRWKKKLAELKNMAPLESNNER